MAKEPKSSSSEPFVSQQDRPNVHPDTPLSELRVRDLQTILAYKTTDKLFEKLLYRDVKHVDKLVHEKLDIRHEIPVVWPPVWPPIGPDPGAINQIALSLTGLQNAVNQLANEIEQLKAKAAKG